MPRPPSASVVRAATVMLRARERPRPRGRVRAPVARRPAPQAPFRAGRIWRRPKPGPYPWVLIVTAATGRPKRSSSDISSAMSGMRKLRLRGRSVTRVGLCCCNTIAASPAIRDPARPCAAGGRVITGPTDPDDHDVRVGPCRARQHGALDLSGDEVTGQRIQDDAVAAAPASSRSGRCGSSPRRCRLRSAATSSREVVRFAHHAVGAQDGDPVARMSVTTGPVAQRAARGGERSSSVTAPSRRASGRSPGRRREVVQSADEIEALPQGLHEFGAARR